MTHVCDITKHVSANHIEYRCGDLPHSTNDEPSIVRWDGTQEWHCHGKLHRENKPAVIRTNGRREWYKDGRRYRDNDMPAVIDGDGALFWYRQ